MGCMSQLYYPRHLEPRLRKALNDSPVVLIQGPRQCGKTTLARMLAGSAGYEYFSFDDAGTLQAATDDPTGFVAGLPERVIIDEVQKVPSLFSAIKLSVDRNRVAGRFILTGSATVLHIRQITDSLAGRMDIIRLHPLSQSELLQTVPRFLETLFDGEFRISKVTASNQRIAERIVAGGYPEALQRSGERIASWYQSYIDAVIRRDLPDIAKIRSVEALSQLLSLAASRTANLLSVNSLAKGFQLNTHTVRSYINLLETMFLLERIPAWHTNRAKRLIKTPKLHIGDTGIACALMNLNVTSLEYDRLLFGHLLETFVLRELQKQVSGYEQRYHFYHYREKDGAEVDFVVERDALSLVGLEVKASATVNKADFKGLRRLKNAAGDRFKGGALVYTGETILPFGDTMYALPLPLLWESG